MMKVIYLMLLFAMAFAKPSYDLHGLSVENYLRSLLTAQAAEEELPHYDEQAQAAEEELPQVQDNEQYRITLEFICDFLKDCQDQCETAYGNDYQVCTYLGTAQEALDCVVPAKVSVGRSFKQLKEMLEKAIQN